MAKADASAFSTRSLPMPPTIWNNRPETRRAARIIRPHGGNLPQPEDHRDQERNQAEGEGDGPEGGIVEEDDAKNRKQKEDRQQSVGDDALYPVAKFLKRHPRHGQIARRMAVQNAWRKAHEAVPEGRFDARSRAPLEPRHRRALKEVQQGAEQAEARHRHGRGIERSGGSADAPPGSRRTRARVLAPA